MATCSSCRATFTCGMRETDAPCWCASRASLKAPDPAADCLCPACLDARLAVERSASSSADAARRFVAALAVASIHALAFLALMQAPSAHAAPPSQLAVLRACGDADSAAECERVIEAEQLKQFPDVASRAGGVLRLKTKTGTIDLVDTGVPGKDDEAPNFRAYAFWDYWFTRSAAVVSVTAAAGDHYLLVDLDRGTQTKLVAEPNLSPDATRFVVPDLCETQCGNVIELWRFERNRPVRDRVYKPKEKWYEADLRWKDPTTLEVEYSTAVRKTSTADDAPPELVRARPQLLRLGDRIWTVDDAGRP
jgi:hypothetical protein